MRMSALLGEAARDLWSGTSRAGWWAIGWGLILFVLMGADSAAVTGLLADAQRYQDEAASIVTVENPRGIDGASCDALSRIAGVRAAGAIREGETPLVAAALPRSPVALFDVTPGFAAVLGPPARGGEVTAATPHITVTTDVAEALGVVTGQSIVSDRGRVQIDDTFAYPVDGRRAGLGWAALSESGIGVYDECRIATWPTSPALRPVLLTVIAASADPAARVTIGQVNTRLGAGFAGDARYRERVTATVPVILVVLAALVGALSARTRRLEIAARLHDGATPSAVCLLMVTEALAWMVPTALGGVAIAGVVSLGVPGPDAAAILARAAVSAAAALAGGVAGVAAAVGLLRERHLFAYFSDR